MNLPQPLHPAIVHFPVVLILLGAPLAVVAVFVRRWHLPLIAAVVLALGAASTFVAIATGEGEEDAAERAGAAAEKVLHEHEEAADVTRTAAVAAAVLAGLSGFLFRWPLAARGAAALAAIAACTAALAVAQAGHLGGRLVYEFGAGVKSQPASSYEGAASGDTGKQQEKGKGHKHEDDDD